jgi:crossover junction endodeoxyribonuclease RuvC
MIVLGIDPGSRCTGWGVVRQEGSRLQLVALGMLRPSARMALPARLAFLHAGLQQLLATHEPDVVGLESVFHGPNTRSLVVLGQARGALLSAVGAVTADLVELSPAEIKKAVTGAGTATKEQVSHMVGAMLGARVARDAQALGGTARFDATDALAVAIATLHRGPRIAAV